MFAPVVRLQGIDQVYVYDISDVPPRIICVYRHQAQLGKSP
jgi:hypothetical protein